MPDQDNSYRNPEDLLVGADGPRPLPLAVRARLEDALTEQSARPLSPEVRGRLEKSLRPQGTSRKWAVMVPGLAAAAAVVVVAALVVPGLVHKAPASTSVNNLALPALHRSALPGAASTKSLPTTELPTTERAGNFGVTHQVGGQVAQVPSVGVAARAPGALAVTVPPEVDAVSPRSGPPTGGAWVLVTGTGLGGVAAVRFGTVSAARVIVVSAEEVRALSPVHAPGTVDVIVAGQIRKSRASLADHYTFTP